MKKWKTNEIQIRDPFVLKENGSYYLFGSTDKNIWGQGTSVGFQAYKGEDLEHGKVLLMYFFRRKIIGERITFGRRRYIFIMVLTICLRPLEVRIKCEEQQF